jgi:hypothetical protein
MQHHFSLSVRHLQVKHKPKIFDLEKPQLILMIRRGGKLRIQVVDAVGLCKRRAGRRRLAVDYVDFLLCPTHFSYQ